MAEADRRTGKIFVLNFQQCSYETTYNLSHAKAQSSQRKAFKMLINLAPLRLCEKIISFFGDQTVCPLAGGLAEREVDPF
jgi:hypothetical protein